MAVDPTAEALAVQVLLERAYTRFGRLMELGSVTTSLPGWWIQEALRRRFGKVLQ